MEQPSVEADEREFDVILWGATGFTGRLVAAHLLARHGCGGGVRWALAGRNQTALEALRRELGEKAADLPLVLADADDQDRLDALARRTRVVCSTVGPYALYGSRLVAACAHHGTHYCDLTGEVPWMRRMIDTFHARARDTGARIVHSCGFDSIPSDLGVLFLQREAYRRWSGYCGAVKFRVREMRGSLSGGTLASLLNVMEESRQDRAVGDLLDDPYALNPAGERSGLDGPERTLPEYDADFRCWVTPFVMGAINTRVVRRSHALAGFPYGRGFRYDEGLLMPFGPWGFPLAAAVSTGSAWMRAASSLRALRQALTRLLPAPGQGPSPAAQAAGRYVVDLFGRHPSGYVQVRVRGDRDPGYGSTSKMLGEAAVCLARDPLTSEGGVLTPATAMGEALLERLPTHAGVTFEVLE